MTFYIYYSVELGKFQISKSPKNRSVKMRFFKKWNPSFSFLKI
nr:MAG TPA: hypothetical protein [Caudoviricetes sp.]